MREISVKEAAEFLGGEIVGNPDSSFTMVARIEDAGKGTLTFLANPKYIEHIYTTTADVVLVNEDLELKSDINSTLIRVDDAYIGFCKILNRYFNPSNARKGIEGGAHVSDDATIGEDCYIGHGSYIGKGASIGDRTKIYPNTYIGDGVKVGSDTVIYANVSVYYDGRIGNNVIIHSGAVVGSDGFGHARQKDGSYIKIPQIGNVIIEDDVEIGANTTIDRATMGSTIIRKGAKLDNLIMVAHNVEIGEHTVIAGQSGISGSTKLGNYCVIAGQVGFAGHIKIADGSQIGAQSGVSNHIKEPNQRWFGSPILPLRDALRSFGVFKSLPELRDKINELEKQVNSKEDKED